MARDEFSSNAAYIEVSEEGKNHSLTSTGTREGSEEKGGGGNRVCQLVSLSGREKTRPAAPLI